MLGFGLTSLPSPHGRCGKSTIHRRTINFNFSASAVFGMSGVTHLPYSLVAHVLVITKITNLMRSRALKAIVIGV
jgi:hypothetical protein